MDGWMAMNSLRNFFDVFTQNTTARKNWPRVFDLTTAEEAAACLRGRSLLPVSTASWWRPLPAFHAEARRLD